MKWLKKLLNIHDCEFEDYKPMEPIGITMGWNMKPTIEYRSFQKCKHCHKERVRGGWCFIRDHELHPENYDEEGNPLSKFKPTKWEIL